MEYAIDGKKIVAAVITSTGPQSELVAHIPPENDKAWNLVRAANEALSASALSPAVSFLLSARRSLPKSMGDRDRIEFMSKMLWRAVGAGMSFHVDDAEALKRIEEHTQVGVLTGLNEQLYSHACGCGSTYARMYEKAREMRPWYAPVTRKADWKGVGPVLYDNRVGPRMVVLIKAEDEQPGLMRDGEHQLWIVTSQAPQTLMLCRYKSAGEARFVQDQYRVDGSPTTRRKYSRADWEREFPRQRGPAGVDAAAEPDSLRPRERAGIAG